MKSKLYSVYDLKARVFFKPFTEINDATATRAFSVSLADHPNLTDYELYRVGSFDDQTAALEPTDPVQIYSGFSVAAVAANGSEEESEK